MEKFDIFTKVTEPTDWVNSMAVVHKCNTFQRLVDGTYENLPRVTGLSDDILVTRSPVLTFYDRKKELTLRANASEKATSVTLMQECRSIEYMSRAFEESKQNWAFIEREMLAIVYGCERFHQYMYGRKTTDHKPLETITRKPISSTPKRLQRMIMELQRYRADHPTANEKSERREERSVPEPARATQQPVHGLARATQHPRTRTCYSYTTPPYTDLLELHNTPVHGLARATQHPRTRTC